MFERGCQETTYFMLNLRSTLGGSRPPCESSAVSRKHQPGPSSMASHAAKPTYDSLRLNIRGLPPHRTYLRLCVDSVLLCVRNGRALVR
jgi:hypothetical protein